MTLRAPFPWFGGKIRAAAEIWARFGAVDNYVEPFFGSGAVLLGAPQIASTETVNDLDGFVCNFWRALAADPDAVARWADWPVNENDLHARHAWLVGQRTTFTARLEGDPEFYDAKVAGWWVWGIACWIGSGWCSAQGPWRVVDGMLQNVGNGVKRQRVHLGDAGQGVNRKRVHLGDAGQGDSSSGLRSWFADLAARLRRVRVCCGDWLRVCGPTPTVKLGLTAVLLDPPYSEGERDMNLYAKDSGTVAADVRAWALEHGDDPSMRIALCGYECEHDMPGWTAFAWKAHGGYALQGDGENVNAERETIWFSPSCLSAAEPSQLSMFGATP